MVGNYCLIIAVMNVNRRNGTFQYNLNTFGSQPKNKTTTTTTTTTQGYSAIIVSFSCSTNSQKERMDANTTGTSPSLPSLLTPPPHTHTLITSHDGVRHGESARNESSLQRRRQRACPRVPLATAVCRLYHTSPGTPTTSWVFFSGSFTPTAQR